MFCNVLPSIRGAILCVQKVFPTFLIPQYPILFPSGCLNIFPGGNVCVYFFTRSNSEVIIIVFDLVKFIWQDQIFTWRYSAQKVPDLEIICMFFQYILIFGDKIRYTYNFYIISGFVVNYNELAQSLIASMVWRPLVQYDVRGERTVQNLTGSRHGLKINL